MTGQASFTVHRNGKQIADGRGTDKEVEATADHYVSLYAHEGDVHIRVQMTGNKRKSK